jgi:WS/DGAT/MGAT family acyltransferase
MMPRTPQPMAPTGVRLTMQDASFLYGESFSGPTHIGSISFFEGEIPFDKLVAHVETRLHLVGRYRQKLGFVPFNLNHAVWHDDPDFRIENHVKRHQLPAGATEDEAVAAAMRVHEPPLDRSRPLWEMHSFEGLPDRTLLLWKIHHCLVDGVSGVEISTVIMDFAPDAPDPEPPAEPWTAAPPPDPSALVFDAIQDLLQAQLDRARQAQQTLRRQESLSERNSLLNQATTSMVQMATQPIVAAPWSAGQVTQRRALAWCKYAFSDFRAIRTSLGGTVNDVVLTVLGEAAARYIETHGYRTEGQLLRVGCPVSVRRESEGGALGNRVSMMFPTMPANRMEPAARLAAVSKETERIKAAREPQGLELMMESGDTVPPSLMATVSLFSSASIDAAAAWAAFLPPPAAPVFQPAAYGINFVATNVPGVQVPQYLAGHKVLDSVGLIPLAGNSGYGVAIGSYNQNMYFGLMSEPRLMPDVGVMKDLCDEVFAELLEAAGSKEG